MEFKVGDVLSGAFHYTMRIPFFYEIVKISPSGKTFDCKLLRTYNYTDDGYGQNGQKMPLLGNYDEGSYISYIQCRLKGNCIRNAKHQIDLYKWNGKPEDFWSD